MSSCLAKPIVLLNNRSLRMISRLLPRARRLLQFAETRCAIFLSLIIYLSFRCWPLFTSRVPRYQHLGAEYYNIAIALAEGRGFSDPFAELSGSTAWMPPAYPALLAALLSVLRTRVFVADAIVYLTIVSLTGAGVIVFHIAKSYATGISPWLGVGLYLVWILVYYDWFFTMTHDIWLLTLLLSLMLWQVFRYCSNGSASAWAWGVLGGIVTLSSPALAATWYVLSGTAFVRLHRLRGSLLFAVALAACMTGPWLVRNELVFHRLIPMKANVFYEAYYANYQDDDGIYDGDFKDHPFGTPSSRFRYARMGEVAFIEEQRQKFFAAFADDPGRYLQNVARRALAVTVHYVPLKVAQRHGLPLWLERIVYVLPFAGLLLAWRMRGSVRRVLAPITLLWGFYLLPYVLVAFYLRYIMPVAPLLALFMFFGVDHIVSVARVSMARSRNPMAKNA
jgi:hypothetical protein